MQLNSIESCLKVESAYKIKELPTEHSFTRCRGSVEPRGEQII